MVNELIVTISKEQQITIPFEISNKMGLIIGANMEIDQEGNKIIVER